MAHTPDVGSSQPLFLSGYQVQVGVFGHNVSYPFRSPVRGIVVHHQDRHFMSNEPELLMEDLDQGFNIFRFVVRRNDDHDTHAVSIHLIIGNFSKSFRNRENVLNICE